MEWSLQDPVMESLVDTCLARTAPSVLCAHKRGSGDIRRCCMWSWSALQTFPLRSEWKNCGAMVGYDKVSKTIMIKSVGGSMVKSTELHDGVSESAGM